MNPKFSIVLIARNEAKTLPRLIASLAEFKKRGGEMILVDTGSTDATVQVARDAGFRVEEVGERFMRTITKEEAFEIACSFQKGGDAEIVAEGQRNFDYSAARNYAASLATNDMIAMPDCDEAYTMLNIDAIDAMIEKGVSHFEYEFVYAHDAEGAPQIQFRHSKFYDRMKMHWTGIIHEVLAGAGSPVYVGEDTIKLEHWQNMETKRGHYLTGLALACLEEPENDRNSHYFGRELMYTGRFESAIEELKRHIAMNKWDDERGQSMIYIGDCLLVLGRPTEALGWFANAFDVSPQRREPLMRIAEYYYRKGSADHVISYVAAALQIKPGNSFYGNEVRYYEALPHEMMYWALWQKQEYKASKMHFDICFGYQPFNEKYMHDFRYYYELPEISFIVESNGDEDAVIATESSLAMLDYPIEKIQILSRDTSDEESPSVRDLVEKSETPWFVFVPAGFAFEKDSVMTAFKVAMDNGKKFMAFNTGEKSPDAGGMCEAFLVKRDVYLKIISSVDTYVSGSTWEAVRKATQPMWCKRALITKPVPVNLPAV